MTETKRAGRRAGAFAGAFAGALLASVLATPASAAEVTADRLMNPEPENWLHVHNTYDANRFSQLDQINKSNVKDLRVAFTVGLGGVEGGGNWQFGALQGNPLAEDGFLYQVDAWGSIYAIDVRAGTHGRITWVMDPGVDKADVWLPANRGLAMGGNRIYSVTGDTRVLATNKETGEIEWDINIAVTDADTLTTAPLLAGDVLLVGGSGGDRGARSWLVGMDPTTGRILWRTFTIPAPGEPGSETWADDHNAWQTGGASLWQTGAYDPDTNTTYWGTGQPVPMYDPEFRPGDNLYSNSSIAIDVATGELKWHFQYTPGDYLDYDEVGSQLLFETNIDGENRKVLGHFGRNGFFYDLDRATGQFLNAGQYVDQLTWTDGIDPKTGKPVEYDSTKLLQEYKFTPRRGGAAVINCPDLQGGINYFPTSFSPLSGLAYGAGIEGCFELTVNPDRSPGGADGAFNGGDTQKSGRMSGSLNAVDPSTGQLTAQNLLKYPVYSGVFSSAGGLVFTTQMDGSFTAHDDKTLAELYRFNVGTGVNAPPISYGWDGKQYIALAVGYGQISKITMVPTNPELANMQPTSVMYVFALP